MNPLQAIRARSLWALLSLTALAALLAGHATSTGPAGASTIETATSRTEATKTQGVITQKTPGGDNAIAPDGQTIVQNDVPLPLRLKNKGGSDGAGLCVFTSCNVSGNWQNIPLLQDFRDWMTRFPGGGWPEKLTDMINKKAKAKGTPPPAYIQFTSNDLVVLELAVKTGRVPCVTYAFSPTGRYRGARIAHMVNLVHAGVGQAPDGSPWYAVLDNNYPEMLEWMSKKTFLKVYSGGKTGWGVVFLSPSPPPIPLSS